jgi:hypothetical protein
MRQYTKDIYGSQTFLHKYNIISLLALAYTHTTYVYTGSTHKGCQRPFFNNHKLIWKRDFLEKDQTGENVRGVMNYLYLLLSAD